MGKKSLADTLFRCAFRERMSRFTQSIPRMKTFKTENSIKKGVHFYSFQLVISILLLALISCSDSSTSAQEAEPEPIPEVSTERFDSQFDLPEDLKVTCLTGETEPGFPTTIECPVIKWLDHTYWALSFRDNRISMAIVAINSEGEITDRWDQDGDRYIWKIELDEEAETATLIGQSSREIVVPWDQLRVQ
jgi:hypothetical protein